LLSITAAANVVVRSSAHARAQVQSPYITVAATFDVALCIGGGDGINQLNPLAALPRQPPQDSERIASPDQ
jgi:hypothetical protein